MTSSTDDRKRSITDVKAASDQIEDVPQAERLLEQWPLLRDLTQERRDEINKRVLKKLDWIFLPCITMMLLMNYLDRINVSNARLAGMQKDLGMSDTEWSAGISLFYVGYIISQVPANVILAKGNPRLLLPLCMLGWSATTICMTALSSGWGFMLCRFIVGITEGPFVPAVSLMTSSWYTKHESPMRMSIWHAGNIISNVISGLLAAAILTTMEGISGLHAWQWFVLIEGIVSIAVAVVSFWCIPKWPNNTGTYFLTAEESEMAQYRMQISNGGYTEDDEGTRWGGVILAAKDPFTWMFACLHFWVIIGQSFKDFFPSILETFHFNKTGTYLLQAPPYLFAYGVCLAVSWSSGRLLEHCWHIVCAMAAALVGAVILISTLAQAPRYFGLFLLCSGPFIALNLHLSWETTNVARPRTKRAALVAIANSASSVTHWFSPYFFLTYQAPRYAMGGGIIIVGCGASILSCFMIKWWVNRNNKQLEARQAESGECNEWRFVS